MVARVPVFQLSLLLLLIRISVKLSNTDIRPMAQYVVIRVDGGGASRCRGFQPESVGDGWASAGAGFFTEIWPQQRKENT